MNLKLSEFSDENSKEVVDLFYKTFSDSEGINEGKIISELAYNFITKTNRNNLYIFIANVENKIVGAIIFSRIKFEKQNINAFLLGPVAIHTNYQGKGIGKKLIDYGHSYLKKNDVELVFTYGDINFYSKFGYKLIPQEIVKAPQNLSYPEGWLGKTLTNNEIQPIVGNLYCEDVIDYPYYW